MYPQQKVHQKHPQTHKVNLGRSILSGLFGFIMIADRFDWPIGTDAERAEFSYPPGKWTISNPFLNKYDLGYHEALDLNLNYPYHNADKGQFVYSCANGVVIFAERVLVPGHTSWGNLVNILHTLPTGKQIVSRYGHVDNLLVKKGDEVTRGQLFAQVGNAFGRFTHHLHWGLCTNINLMLEKPWDWPGFDYNRVINNYIDPVSFVAHNRIVDTSPPFIANKVLVRAKNNLNVRQKPSFLSARIDQIEKDSEFVVINKLESNYVKLAALDGYVIENELSYLENLDGNSMRRTIDDLTVRDKPSRYSIAKRIIKQGDVLEIVGVERNKYTALSNGLGWVLTDYLVKA